MNTYVTIGCSALNSKKFMLPFPDMTVSSIPVNRQVEGCKDRFSVIVSRSNPQMAVVTRVDQRTGWEQDLVLEATVSPPMPLAMSSDMTMSTSSDMTMSMSSDMIMSMSSVMPMSSSPTKSIADRFKDKEDYTIIHVGSSRQPIKVVTLPKPHMIVSPIPKTSSSNPNDVDAGTDVDVDVDVDADTDDMFDVFVVGNKCYITRSDIYTGWKQNLILHAIEDPQWKPNIIVGSNDGCTSKSKKVRLNVKNLDISPYPYNKQDDKSKKDLFTVDVNGKHATISKIINQSKNKINSNSNFDWEQELVLCSRKLNNWSTEVDILYGPSDDHIYVPNEKITFTMAVLPQNNFNGAITQVYCYIGPKFGFKKFYPLYHGVPGSNPSVAIIEITYIVPSYPSDIFTNHAGGDGFMLEIGYGSDLQYTMKNANKNFNDHGQRGTTIDYLPVNIPMNEKSISGCNGFQCNYLGSSFPIMAIANEPLSLDLFYKLQDNDTNAKSTSAPTPTSQIFIYFKDEDGGVDLVQISCESSIISDNSNKPQAKRGGVTYLVPDMVGKQIEVGAYFNVQSKLGDAVHNFKKNGMIGSKIFGSFTIISQDDQDTPRVRKDNKVGFKVNNNNHPKLQREIVKKISSTYYKTLRKGGQTAVDKISDKLLKYGARKAAAAAACDATINVMKEISKKTGKSPTSFINKMQAGRGFASGVKVVSKTTGRHPIMFVSMIGEFQEKLRSRTTDINDVRGNNSVGLAGSMAIGARLGNIVPGIRTVSGSDEGIGKATESIFCLF